MQFALVAPDMRAKLDSVYARIKQGVYPVKRLPFGLYFWPSKMIIPAKDVEEATMMKFYAPALKGYKQFFWAWGRCMYAYTEPLKTCLCIMGRRVISLEVFEEMFGDLKRKVLAQKRFCAENDLMPRVPDDGLCPNCGESVFGNLDEKEYGGSYITQCLFCNWHLRVSYDILKDI